MYEEKTYEALLESALERITDPVDKREGSLVMNGVAPAMAELAQLYIALDFVFSATYVLTAPREYLIMRASDRNMAPKEATAAIYRAEFDIEVPIGSRFSCEDLNFRVTERMSSKDTESALSYKVVCETAGSIANSYTGALIPIEYIAGLGRAELVELIIPGSDEEETEAFRQRVLESMKSEAFAGNQADYRKKVLEVAGVAAVKVYPVWNEDTPPSSLIPSLAVQQWFASNTIDNADAQQWLERVYSAALNKKLAVGGCVKVVVMAANNSVPSEGLLDIIQTKLDPTQNAGEGLGLAPIGHVVHVTGVVPVPITVSSTITLFPGYAWDDVKESINSAVKDYFSELSAEWGKGSDIGIANSQNLVVRISQIESRILSHCKSFVADIADTKLNGLQKNVTLDGDSIPVLASGGVTNG